jgi:DNA-binding transcriptional regulator LsrR (DeoR family)
MEDGYPLGRWSPMDDAVCVVVGMYARGAGQKRIARALGVSRDAIRRIYRIEGLPARA